MIPIITPLMVIELKPKSETQYNAGSIYIPFVRKPMLVKYG